ncbi:MAG: penicillin acylase family protein [Saprospiraceae bacterium]|nr:penicillin acylase family protein [Saprospiraceae bacterium]
MRLIKFLLSLLVTILLVWQLARPQQAGDKTLPPPGAFFNPFSGFWTNAESVGAPVFHDISMPGLKGPVQVVYDDLMVPHIFAQNMEDAARVQGYITAQHRLWQMDITARKASGRLSEVLGERTLRIDRLARRRGMVFAAENDLIGWRKSPETMVLLDAYTAGVNAWISQMSKADWPIEYKLLDYAPEPWTALKAALVTEAMAETLCAWDDDLESTNTFAQLGPEAFEYLYPEWNPKQQPIIPDTGQWKGLSPLLPPPFVASATNRLGALEPVEYQNEEHYKYDGPIVGSNNWAVSGQKTRSGKPILCNDPHLNLTLPSIWFQIQIHTPQTNTYGVSLPGVPGVVIGFNEHIAWGMTNVSHDVSDWYKIHWINAERSKYKLDNEEKSVTYRYEEIGVKGGKTLLDTVRYTVFGPVTYDFESDNPLRDCAFRWMAHDVPERSAFETFLGLNTGKNYEDYKAALPGFDAPAQNIVFASRTGDIAIQVQGKYPVRGLQQGRFVQEGDRWINAWHNYIPQEQVPSMKNPSRGFVFSANQHSTPPSYPYYYVGNFEDWRSRRIHDQLAAMQAVTPEHMKNLQLDNFSQRAADALPVMLQLLDRSQLDDYGRQMADELSRWNYRYDPDALAPLLFDVWFDSCYEATWDEISILEKNGNSPLHTDDLAAVKNQKVAMLYPEAWRFIDMMQTDSASIYFDHPATPFRETVRDIVLESFKLAQQYFQQNPEQRAAYSQTKGFELRHLGQIPAFGRMDLKIGGHRTAPNAMSKTNGPSWRMIVELGDEINALGVYPGGQSGNPGSMYYDNMVNTWASGNYYELLLMKSPDDGTGRVLGKQVFKPQ